MKLERLDKLAKQLLAMSEKLGNPSEVFPV
jgi:hypothetical protein